MKLLLFLTFFCLSVHDLKASIGKYPIKNFTPIDYEAGIQNIDFAQNRDMTLFVANNLGVLSYNGNGWGTHAYQTGKKQRSLAFDENTNRLYVGSQGEFGYFEGDWNYISLINKIPAGFGDFDEVWDVYLLDSKVFFCTFQGIYIYDGETIEAIKGNEAFNKSFVAGNRLFTQNAAGLLLEIRDGKLSRSLQQGQRGQIISGIIPKEDGHLLFYNSGNIEFSTSRGVSEAFPTLIRVLEGKFVNHVTQLSDTRLVISTQRAGLFLFDMIDGAIENITAEDGLQSRACLRTFEDHSGSLWVGMQNGLALIDINSPMRFINRDINLQGSGYEAFDAEEGKYYTTSNGIYFLPIGADKCLFLEGTEGPAYGLQRILDRLYAGHHTGLFLLQDGVAKRTASTNGLWQVKLLRTNPKYAVGGTYDGLHLFRVNERMELEGIQKIEGFDESSRFFEEDDKGRIWVGQFYKGLFQLKLSESLSEAEVTKVSDESAHPVREHIILSRMEDELYLGTEAGVYKIDQAGDQIIRAGKFSEILGKDWIYLLAQGNQKIVHVVTENSVGFVKQVSANNYIYVPSSLFQLRHSFNNDLLNVSVNVQDGVLFNANEGFIQYDPDLEDRLVIEKVPVVTKVYAVAEDSILFSCLPFQMRKDKTETIMIKEGLKVLQFTVEDFKFKGAGQKRYRYFLRGFDKDYGRWTNATVKEYTNLKVGEYEFFVQTLNSFGENVTGRELLLSVAPPFYKSMWMRAIYFMLAIMLLFQGYRFQKGYFKRKEKQIEERRQVELSQKQNELQRVKEEKIESELHHVNNLLAASTMNLVVKNEFMENIKEELKKVSLQKDQAEGRFALDMIVKEIDTGLKLQEDWKQFEYHFDRVHGDFLTRLTNEFTDLTPGEQKLCAFLRLKMDTKEIANLMTISLRGVEVARYRLRKKFRLETYQNLSKFILEY